METEVLEVPESIKQFSEKKGTLDKYVVVGKVITDALLYKPDTYTGQTKVANQKIVQLTRAQYNAIQNKDPNTYYMITDDTEPSVRTAYVPISSTDIFERRVSDNKIQFSFAAPEDYSLLEVRVGYSINCNCGVWQDANLTFTDTLSIPAGRTETPREGRKIYSEFLVDGYVGPGQTHVEKSVAFLIGANYITSDGNGTITIEIGNLTASYNNVTDTDPDNTTVMINSVNILELGYIAYGSDNITITESDYTAGEGININPNGVISIDAEYGASLEMTVDSDTYIITTVLKDQNGNTLGQTQTIDLPLESVVVSGRYDTATKTIILTLKGGSTISIPVGDLVSGLESESNKVPSIGASSTNVEYPSAKAVYDAIQDINEVPDATTIVDNGKVLTVDSTGNAVWSTPSIGVTDYSLLSNKPSINNVELSGNKTAAQLGLVETSDLNNYLTITSAANTYQTKAGMSNYLSNATVASTYLTQSDAASDYLTKSDAASTYQSAGSYAAQSDISDMATETWVGQQGYETSSHAASTYQTQAGMSSYATQSNIFDMATQTWVGQQGYETSSHAASTYQTHAGMSSYATQTDIADMATETWVGQQGFLTSADEVPAVISSDDGKVLTASYTGGVGSYSWQTASGGGGGIQVETDGTNYWITVNGIRLYFASSAPTGTIPDRSMGIGW